MGLREDLKQQLENDREENIQFIQNLVRIPSENPPGDTTELYAFVEEWMKSSGLDYETVTPVPEWPNLLAMTEMARPGKHLVLNGHLDIFPAGPAERWTGEAPYSGEIRDGKMYGRGVSDMKVGTGSSFLAYRYMHGLRDQLAGRLTMTAVSDEETGGVWGTQYLLKNRKKETHGDCVLNGEPSTPATIRFGEKGPLWIEMHVQTTGGHGAYTHQADSASLRAAEIIGELRKLEGLEFPEPPDVISRVEEARDALDGVLGAGATDVVRSVTLNIGSIHAGLKMNVVPGDCEVEVDLRCPPGMTHERLLKAFNEIINKYEGVTYKVVGGHDPSYCDPDHEIIPMIQKNAEVARGMKPLPAISIGGTDCRLWRAIGIPAYVYGPTPYFMGAPDEHVLMEDLLGTIETHVMTAFDYLMAGAES